MRQLDSSQKSFLLVATAGLFLALWRLKTPTSGKPIYTSATQALNDHPERKEAYRVLSFLEKNEIPHRTQFHRAVFTCEDAQDIKLDLPGGHCKNLFLEDKKKRMFLLVALQSSKVVLRKLKHELTNQDIECTRRMSFTSPERLHKILGVTPGSVTPFAILNDKDNEVQVLLDNKMAAHKTVNFHPLTNQATTNISMDSLMKFFNILNHPVVFVNTNP